MKIIVCAKQVPDTNEVRIDPVKGTLIREGVPSILNPTTPTLWRPRWSSGTNTPALP